MKLFLVLLGLALGLLAGEVLLRAAQPDGWDFSPARNRRQGRMKAQYPYDYDALLGWAPVPGRKIAAEGRTQTVDSLGLRAHASERAPSPGAGILILGDSWTWGDEVGDEESFPAFLEADCGRKVYNGGVCGYGLDQMALRAPGLIDATSPGLVVVALVGEDLFRCGLSCRGAHKPFFVPAEGGPALKNVPVPRRFCRNPGCLASDILGTSRLAELVGTRLAPDWWRGWHYMHSAHHQEALLVESLLARIRKAAEERGAGTLLLLIPTRVPEKDERYRPLLLEAAGGLGIPVLDLTMQKPEEWGPGREPPAGWYAPGGHNGPEGNRWVARSLAAFLKETGLLPGPGGAVP